MKSRLRGYARRPRWDRFTTEGRMWLVCGVLYLLLFLALGLEIR